MPSIRAVLADVITYISGIVQSLFEMASPTTTAAVQVAVQPSLTGIPPELRMVIYNFLCINPPKIFAAMVYRTQLSLAVYPKLPLRLMKTCRLICTEIRPIIETMPIGLQARQGCELPAICRLLQPRIFRRIVDLELVFPYIYGGRNVNYHTYFGLNSQHIANRLSPALQRVKFVGLKVRTVHGPPGARATLLYFCNLLVQNHPNLNSITELDVGPEDSAFEVTV